MQSGQPPSGYVPPMPPVDPRESGQQSAEDGQRPASKPGFAMPKAPYQQPEELSAFDIRRPVWQVIIGAVVFAVGLSITLYTLPGFFSGGLFFIAWTPMIAGLTAVVRGVLAMGPPDQPTEPGPHDGAMS